MKNFNFKVYIVLLIFLIIILYAGKWETYYCQASRVNVRSQPNTKSQILGTLKINDAITPIDEIAKWFKISYQGQEAWVFKAFFSEEKVQTKEYWYDSNHDVLHNSSCKWYGHTRAGFFTNEELGRDCALCGGANRIEEPLPASEYKYWINTKTGVRHNSSCKLFGNTPKGKYTNKKIGKACPICGG